MDDYGKKARMDILERNFDGRVKNIILEHGWKCEIENRMDKGEYLVVKLEKYSTVKRIAILYSQSTDRAVYRYLEKTVNACLLNGLSFDSNNYFTAGLSIPITLSGNIVELLTDWNQEAYANNTSNTSDDNTTSELSIDNSPINKQVLRLVAENPSEQVWMMLKMLKSADICEKIVKTRALAENIQISNNDVREKAKGVSFLIQNACEYYEAAFNKNLTQRLLNIYYGTLAFMEAEMLSSPKGYLNLNKVEAVTKQGHGMYTLELENNKELGELYTGVLGQGCGLFPSWLASRGWDIGNFPTRKAKTEPDSFCFTLNELLNRIPELAALMQLVDRNYKPGFFQPVYSVELNRSYRSFNTEGGYKSDSHGTYIIFYDNSGCGDIQIAKSIKGPIEQHEIYKDRDGNVCYKVFIRHIDEKDTYWWSVLNTHKSPFCQTSIIVPVLTYGDDWEICAIMILYTLSIIVRYRPNLWRRIQYGEWDKYSAVFQQFAMISERILPHVFFERIYGQKLYVHQSDGVIG